MRSWAEGTVTLHALVFNPWRQEQPPKTRFVFTIQIRRTRAIEQFEGDALIQQEPDASSFPAVDCGPHGSPGLYRLGPSGFRDGNRPGKPLYPHHLWHMENPRPQSSPSKLPGNNRGGCLQLF